MKPIKNVHSAIKKLQRVWLYLWRKNQFLEYHYSDVINSPIKITPRFITLEKNVRIYYHGRIEGIGFYQGKKYNPNIILKQGVSIQQNIHLTCAKSVIIGENTAIAANVTITDIHHPYTDINTPIEQQELEVKSVEIGPDCKIYNNAVILPGTKLGKHVTVGANSVVGGYFPDYCVIVGAPAYIIKRYDSVNGVWKKTDKKGNFISE